jgi:hypothetical protein
MALPKTVAERCAGTSGAQAADGTLECLFADFSSKRALAELAFTSGSPKLARGFPSRAEIQAARPV